MDGDLSRIPVQAIPFEHGLNHLAAAIDRKGVKIVAIGSSSTAGEGGIAPYPERLLALLRSDYPGVWIDVINRGVGGEEAPVELKRFDRDVIAEQPDLVIWQVGTNAVWQSPDQKPPPPSFYDTMIAIRDGLAKLHDYGRADVILMDLQYVPAVLTPAKHDKAIAMVEVISELARMAGANVFRRFALMKGWHKIEGISLDRLVDPTDDNRLHDSELATDRVSWALKQAIVDGLAKARSATDTS
jgi:GDSL-like Lipase/Acylhydrolase family